MNFQGISVFMPDQTPMAIKRLRDRLRMNQAQLAESVGATRDQIANYESGRSQVPGRIRSKLESLGMVVAEESSPYNEPPLVIRATRAHLRILVNILADTSIDEHTRALAKAELERAIGLVGF